MSDDQLRNPRALVVDDDARDQHLFRVLLAEEGIEAQGAQSVDAAVAALDGEPFDLIILDVVLGHDDVQQFYAHVVERFAGLASRTLVTSGFDEAEVRLRLPSFEGKVLYKPFTLAEFQEAIRGLDILVGVSGA